MIGAVLAVPVAYSFKNSCREKHEDVTLRTSKPCTTIFDTFRRCYSFCNVYYKEVVENHPHLSLG